MREKKQWDLSNKIVIYMKTLQIGVLKIIIYYMIPRICIMCRSLCYIFPLLALSDTDWQQKEVESKVNIYRWNILGSENSPKCRKSVLRINNTVFQNILQNYLFGVVFLFPILLSLKNIFCYTNKTCLKEIFLILQYCCHRAVILIWKYCYVFS